MLPYGCASYNGPFSVECLGSIWKESGCLPEGTAHPSKLEPQDLAELNNLNLEYVISKWCYVITISEILLKF